MKAEGLQASAAQLLRSLLQPATADMTAALLRASTITVLTGAAGCLGIAGIGCAVAGLWIVVAGRFGPVAGAFSASGALLLLAALAVIAARRTQRPPNPRAPEQIPVEVSSILGILAAFAAGLAAGARPPKP